MSAASICRLVLKVENISAASAYFLMLRRRTANSSSPRTGASVICLSELGLAL